MNERRIHRLQEQIKERLAEVLLRDIADPKLGLVTITRVELDSEFTTCKAYWSVLAPNPAAEAKARTESAGVLVRARGFCQREVGKSLNTRTIPRLLFVFDESIAGAIRVNTLLKELRDQEGKSAAAPAGEPAGEPPAAGPGTPGSGAPGSGISPPRPTN